MITVGSVMRGVAAEDGGVGLGQLAAVDLVDGGIS